MRRGIPMSNRWNRLSPLLDSLRSDATFGLRQLNKSRVTSAAAILSLALAIGACTSAFRLIDALLLRPLPIAHPERLYDVYRHQINFDGQPGTFDGFAYPAFALMRDAAKNDADLVAISYDERMEITYKSDEEMEKAHVEYVSGSMFQVFALKPAQGRVFTENDDLHPGDHPYAVISYDYWQRRFAGQRTAIGSAFRMADRVYEIVGVSEKSFTGTEPGTVIDIFLPAMMHRSVTRSDSTWHRVLAVIKPGARIEPLRAKLDAINLAFETERSKKFTNMAAQNIANYLHQSVTLDPAPSGVSGMQSDNRESLLVLAAIVALVLLTACANVANLMTAQAAARAREMALRISIGAGRWRLVQLVLVESGMRAFLAAIVGGLFAWRAAPFVVSKINPPDDPAQLLLPADWRILGFGLGLALAVTLLFGLAPALRASAVKPVSALQGGEDPHSRRRLIHALVAAQVTFCFLVLFVAGLFVATFDRLSHQPTGFSADRVLNLETVTGVAQPPAYWDQVAEHLRSVPGVESVAIVAWPLMSGESSVNFISIHGAPANEVFSDFLSVSPGWIEAMKIPLIDGRDFRREETDPPVTIVNQAFANQFFDGADPVGKTMETIDGATAKRVAFQIVGFVRDARSRDDMRLPIRPTAYVPFRAIDAAGALQSKNRGTFVVRTSTANPLALASLLRQEVPRARPEFRVNRIRAQVEINLAHALRERLLATLALFFAIVALLLAGVGLYGVLHYSVLQRRREIGIRMAVGAQAAGVVRLVSVEVFSMVLVGAAAGLALGMVSVRYTEALFFQVKATDLTMLAFPSLAILGVALLAALRPVMRAVRIDPASTLRAE